MRRSLLAVFALLLVVGLLPAAARAEDQATTPPGWGKGLGYDLDRVRQAQKAAAERVGPVPEHLADYFAERPAFTFHPRNDARDHGPTILHTTLEDLPKMQEELRRYLARRHRAMAAATQAVGEPMVVKIPALMFRVHNDQWQEQSTPEHLESQLSGIGTSDTGTMTEMYLEQSFGNMVVDVDVFGPYDSAVSNNPVNDCHYGTEGAPVTGSVLGLGGLGARGMAVEAVPQADPDVDFGEYDNDLDGVVDFLLMIHSGPDAAGTGNPCHVWSHYFGPILTEPVREPTVTTTDTNAEGEPVAVGPVMTVPEVDLQIGVTAHEYMHALGEPDYYGTAGTAGTGDWDLGAGGSWLGIPAQTNPPHFNPVMKMNFGWIQPRVVTDTTEDVALHPRASHPELVMVPLTVAEAGSDDAALCDQAPVGVPHQNNAFYTEEGDCLVEGFLLENVSRSSTRLDEACALTPADFDRQLYGSGLMVWHWDFRSYQQLGNNNVMRPMLDVEEFDRRDALQDLSRNITRAQPRDVFWGDPVGMTGATQIAPAEGEIAPPEGSPWTVTGAPGLGAGGTEAQPIPEWEVAEVPEGTGMTVTLSWDVPTDDWDLYVDKQVNGEWVEVAHSAGGAPQTQEQLSYFDFQPGDRFRARAYNWAGPTSPQAEVSVEYDTSGLTQLGPVGTRNNDLEQTGWAFTNIRPNDYRGIAHAAERAGAPIVLDLIRHDETTVDVSGDFLRVDRDSPRPVVAGEAVDLVTNVYNHGGKAVTGATFTLYSGDPERGGTALQSTTMDLGPFARDEARFRVKPGLGTNDLYVVAEAAGDVTPGNDIVRTELDAYPGDGSVLLVDNDFGWTQEETYEAVLNSLGVTYDIVEGEPDAATMGRYDAVIWLTTTVSGAEGVLSKDAQAAIAEHLDGGGELWLATTRAAGYLAAPAAEGGNPEFLAGYFGFEIDQNLLDSMGTVHGLGDAVGGSRSFELGYLDGRPYLDYGVVPDSGVKGAAVGLFEHEAAPDRVVATRVEGEGGFRTVFGLPAGLIDDAAQQRQLVADVLGYFGVATGDAADDRLQVRYERFQHVQTGQDWPVTVGAVGADRAQLVYRTYGGKKWTRLDLTEVAPGLFGGTIPGGHISNDGLEYFVRVRAGGRTLDAGGGPNLPNVASAPYGDAAGLKVPGCKGQATGR